MNKQIRSIVTSWLLAPATVVACIVTVAGQWSVTQPAAAGGLCLRPSGAGIDGYRYYLPPILADGDTQAVSHAATVAELQFMPLSEARRQGIQRLLHMAAVSTPGADRSAMEVKQPARP